MIHKRQIFFRAIQIIRYTLVGGGKRQCHQMTQGGERGVYETVSPITQGGGRAEGFTKVSCDIFYKILKQIFVNLPAFLKEKG